MNSQINYSLDPVRKCMVSKVSFAFKMTQRDLHLIEMIWQELHHSITNLNEIADLFQPASLMSRSIMKVRTDIANYSTDNPRRQMAIYLLNGPIAEFRKAVCGIHACSLDNSFFAHLRELKSLSKPGTSYDQILFNIASEREITAQEIGEQSGLTPFVAKSILFEIIRRSNASLFEYLANNLSLKATYKRLTPDGRVAQEDDYSVTLNNGYIFGSLQEWIDNFANSDPHLIRGYDCTTFVQKCIEETTQQKFIVKKVDGTLLHVRLNTVYLFALIDHRPQDIPFEERSFYMHHFSARKISSETEIVPGDMLFVRGHMVVFTGYRTNLRTGFVELSTIEAVGGEERAVSIFLRDIYKDKINCDEFDLEGRDEIYVLNRMI